MHTDMNITLEKLGFVYKPAGDKAWGLTHAQVPFPLEVNPGSIRVFFATRDAQSRSSVAFVDVDKNDPCKVVYVHDKPCFSHGEPGTFDDSGTMPSWFIQRNGIIWLYYTGWNKSDTASYRLAIGVATSDDGGLNFTRRYEGPLLDRDILDPVWVGQPCVLEENEMFRMWYLSCEKIKSVHGRPEPFYNVKYAETRNALIWTRHRVPCIPFDANTDAIGRPCVWKHNDVYYMLHSNRRADGYRDNADAAYRIELSSSADGLTWKPVKGFHFPKSAEGWDSIMNEYAAVLPYGENKYLLFYNGNGFGQSGFGAAVLTFAD
jgi:predicted GH43/DUF377 family glycosyl hydrolase